MAREKSGNTTETRLVRQACIDSAVRAEFIKSYVDFLTAVILKGCIFAGHGTCSISSPYKNAVIPELKALMVEVCNDFLTQKVTPEFIEKIQKTHRGQADRHVSVRTTLQYLFVNKLKKKTPGSLIVKFEGREIEIYQKNDVFTTGHVYYSKEEVREMLRHLRCLLTRLAGKGNISIYPTPYECYCLYHDCFGTDRKKVVQIYISNPEEQEKFQKEGDWNDAVVGDLLKHRYEGVSQLRNKRAISCERKTVNNRRREYQKLLSDCIQYYMPDADPEEVRQILDKRDVDIDIVNHFYLTLIAKTCKTEDEARNKRRTRTLEVPK